ncbi:carbohydrate-responsive element-binding protein-like isoform X2 [Cololabis saira]|uniref:carbohydrate-responsive element-binding protein-like isoform X2 n=1 Tax=Cololabis saira TaxID=129043 RepID=UPI002AD5836A|nr:carbohydrate-responsive element-binding protein-like isoform X2 [Cololabis saira]
MAGRDRVSRRRDSSESESEPGGPGPRGGSLPRTQVIHSGHFMVSSPHSDARSSDFDTVNRTRCHTYRYGPRSAASLRIDPTLTRLFECMSLAYSGNIVSPKWKSFKGLRLLWRDKIRLNNAIWRAWFIQYVKKRMNPVCGFVTPLEGSEAEAHRKPEAIILEGSYWKRRIEVVIKEYHKWRNYYKKRLQKKKDDILSMLQEGQICHAKLDKRSHQIYQEPVAAPAEAHMFDLDCLLSDISDTLFTMTQKPSSWTSDHHNSAYTSNADVIQPGLTPLQPNLDDFMDIPDIFMNYRGHPSEQTGFADCSYFESSSSSTFAPVPSFVETSPQLLIDTQLAKPSGPSDSLPQPSAASQSEQPRLRQDCRGYHSPGITSAAMPYGHQSYHDAPVSLVFTGNAEPLASASVPFLHSMPCHKFGYYTSTSGVSTVITHTASTAGAPASAHQAHGYSQAADAYSQSHGHPLSYPAATPDLLHTALPSAAHRFSVPQQVAVSGVRGKHRQKAGGPRTAGPAAALPGPATSAPAPTSCLAKLLSSSTRERKPTLGFNSALETTKSQSVTSTSSLTGSGAHVGGMSSQLQPGGGWHEALTSLHSQNPAVVHGGPAVGPSRGSAVSALLTRGSTHNGTTLLVPKTEKLSPVQLYGADRSNLSVPFPAHLGQKSPPNPLDKASNPESPQSGFSGHGKTETSKQTETRRITHISAEQKRRFNIKLGFDTLHSLVTTLSSQPSIKISKATTLQKTGEYISKMQQERAQLHEEAQRLRDEIQHLNSSINACQQQLPATGVPITRQRFDYMRQKFREYVRAQTLQNWKFWIFSIIIEPLFESYNGMVSTASVEDLCRSTLSWLDQHCALPALRPMVLSSLRLLSTTTPILTDASLLPEQAALAVTQGDPAAAMDHSFQPAQL